MQHSGAGAVGATASGSGSQSAEAAQPADAFTSTEDALLRAYEDAVAQKERASTEREAMEAEVRLFLLVSQRDELH